MGDHVAMAQFDAIIRKHGVIKFRVDPFSGRIEVADYSGDLLAFDRDAEGAFDALLAADLQCQ